MNTKSSLAITTLAIAIMALAVPTTVWASGNEAHATCDIELKLLKPIELECHTPLDLGRHIFNGGEAHIEVGPDGAVYTEGVMSLEDPYPAHLEAWGEKFCPFTIHVYDAEVVNQMDGSTLSVDLNLPNSQNAMYAVFPEEGHFPFYVGGRIWIDDSTMTGIYKGQFESWVFYN